jgi:hypothetical protein
MVISPDIRPLPPLPHEPPSCLLCIPNLSITLTLPTISSTIYLMATQNYIASYMESKSSKHPTKPLGNYYSDKNNTCSTNSRSPYEMVSMDDSHPWLCNKEAQPAEQRWMDPIHEIIDLYDH